MEDSITSGEFLSVLNGTPEKEQKKTMIVEDRDIDDLFKDGNKPDLITVVDFLVRMSIGSKLDAVFFERAKRLTDTMAEKYHLTPMQCVLFARALELSVSGTSCFDSITLTRPCYGEECTSFSLMHARKDLMELQQKGLMSFAKSEYFNSFFIPNAVIDAFCDDEPYQECNTDIDCNQFMQAVQNQFVKLFYSHNIYIFQDRVKGFLMGNKQLAMVRAINSYSLSENDTTVLLWMCVYKYLNDKNMLFDDVNLIFDRFQGRPIWNSLVDGSDALVQKGLVKSVSLGLDSVAFCLTDNAIADLFSEVKIASTDNIERPKPNLIQCSALQKKELFFNSDEQKQIDLLTAALGIERMKDIRKALEAKGQRKGFACLFYGAPGTGKTETVNQIAIATGRDIMAVDVSSIRDRYYGETEKNIQAVFSSYRKVCETSVATPILLFNEADAIFAKRLTNVGDTCDQTENTIQNIILQEMEKFDGILIATTNLSSNLDSAFERRFLYKIEFAKPTVEARTAIWKSILPGLTDNQASDLAGSYDFSGGQIENIARKEAIDAVLYGRPLESVDMKSVREACDNEKIGRTEKRERGKIGY